MNCSVRGRAAGKARRHTAVDGRAVCSSCSREDRGAALLPNSGTVPEAVRAEPILDRCGDAGISHGKDLGVSTESDRVHIVDPPFYLAPYEARAIEGQAWSFRCARRLPWMLSLSEGTIGFRYVRDQK